MYARASAKSGVLLVLLSTFGLALKGIWARLAYAAGMDVGAVLFYRSILSLPLVLLGAFWLLRAQPAARPRKTAWLPAVLLGVLFAVGMTSDFQAIRYLGASVSRIMLFGFPLLVLVFEAVGNRRWPARQRMLGFAIAFVGLLAVVSAGLSTPRSSVGVGPTALLWGVASLFTYALYVYLSANVTQILGSVRVSVVSQLTTGFVVVLFLLVRERGVLPASSARGFAWVATMVVVSTVIPYFLLMEGIRRLGASEASLLAMGGPVVTVVASWLVLGEALTGLQLLGTAVVMAGVFVGRRVPRQGIQGARAGWRARWCPC